MTAVSCGSDWAVTRRTVTISLFTNNRCGARKGTKILPVDAKKKCPREANARHETSYLKYEYTQQQQQQQRVQLISGPQSHFEDKPLKI